MSAFSRYIGIDYSGAETPESSLKGLRVYCAVGQSPRLADVVDVLPVADAVVVVFGSGSTSLLLPENSGRLPRKSAMNLNFATCPENGVHFTSL